MRILFVGNASSFHTPRWLSQLRGTGWDIHLFDPTNQLIHADLDDVTLYTGWKKAEIPAGVRPRYRWPFARGRFLLRRCFPKLWQRILPAAGIRLARTIERLAPDCIHSLALQDYGEAVFDARRRLGDALPAPWIYSCRGSDIYFFRQFPEHVESIRNVLGACDFLMCNCRRDLRLAKEYGFEGRFLGFFQGGGGYPLEEIRELRQPGPVAARRVIAIKGSQNQFGQSLLCIEALRLCAANLETYTVKIYHLNNQPIRTAAAELSRETGVTVELVPRSPHRTIWSIFGQSRLAIGISRSDGIPNSMVEAMIMGAFPIQTNPGGATAEWIEDGVNGTLVPDDDPEAVAAAITAALRDDRLVEAAATRNAVLARQRVNATAVRPQVLEAYRTVCARDHE